MYEIPSSQKLSRSVLSLAATVLLFFAGPLPAYAQEAHGFDISATDASQAVREFGKQAGVQILASGKLLKGKKLNAVSGELSTESALRLLLADSGLTHRYVGERGVALVATDEQIPGRPSADNSRVGTLRVAQADASNAQPARVTEASDNAAAQGLEEVTVFGRGTQSEPVREVPQSVTVFDRQILDVMPAGSTLKDVVRFLPSASALLGDYSFGSGSYNVRGGLTSYTWNSMLPTLTQSGRVELANVERVEVLMGPSSITYGSMQPGAVINIVTKQPTRELYTELQARAGSFGTYGGALDIGGPLSGRVRARLNASYEDRGAPFDHWAMRSVFVAPVIAFDLTDRTLLTFEASYQRSRFPNGIFDGRVPSAGTLLPNSNGSIPKSLNTGYFADTTHFNQKYFDASLRLRHEFSDALSFNAHIAYNDSRNDGIDGFGGSLTADGRTITRTLSPREQSLDNYVAAVNVASTFTTGAVAHRATAGVDWLDYNEAGNLGSYRTDTGPIPLLDVFSPDYSITGALLLTPTTGPRIKTRVTAAFLQERASFGKRLSLIGGLRYTDSHSQFDSINLQTNVVTGFPDTDAKHWSTQLGALYNVSDAFTLYANRSTSFLPRQGIVQRDGTFYGAPETAVQYELGSRLNFPGSGFTAGLALFHIVRPNVLTADPIDPRFQIAAGELTSKGIEATLAGTILPGWTAFAAYAYNPTEVTRSNIAGQEGLDFRNAPRSTASLITRYEIKGGALEGLGISLGVNHLGDKFADSGNVLVLPATTRVDLGLYYSLNAGVDLSLQGLNLTDEEIYNGFLPTQIQRNAGRSYVFSIRVRPGHWR